MVAISPEVGGLVSAEDISPEDEALVRSVDTSPGFEALIRGVDTAPKLGALIFGVDITSAQHQSLSSESAFRIRWAKYWSSTSASVLPMNPAVPSSRCVPGAVLGNMTREQ